MKYEKLELPMSVCQLAIKMTDIALELDDLRTFKNVQVMYTNGHDFYYCQIKINGQSFNISRNNGSINNYLVYNEFINFINDFA